MSDRVQISCEKQGRNDTSSWSTRILTIDAATTTLTISRHHHPNNVFYHSIRVVEVQQWPHFPPSDIEESYESLHAQRTLLVLGVECMVPPFTLEALEIRREEKPLSGTHKTDATSDASSSASAGSPFAFMTGDSSKRSRPIESGGCDSWLIRFTTKEAYDTAVEALRRFSHVRFNRTESLEVLAATAPTATAPPHLIAPPLGPL